MSKVISISDNFWNIRSPFKVFGLIDIGTHASLVKLQSGKFVLLDSIPIIKGGIVESHINELCNDGLDLEAIINLHPFHTVSIPHMHEQFPKARLYGTNRHHFKFPELPWQSEITESKEFQEIYKKDLAFHVPGGVALVTPNPNVHFSSVIAYHRKSKTLHVDDTFGYSKNVPLLAKALFSEDTVILHPMLTQALEKRTGAGKDFLDWMNKFISEHSEALNLCTAHNASLLANENSGKSVSERLQALITDKVKRQLKIHDKRFS